MKDKSLFLSIITAVAFLLSMQTGLVDLLGPAIANVVIVILALAYPVLLLIMKTYYNTGSWTKGWSTGFFILNTAMFGVSLVSVIYQWSADYGVALSAGLVAGITKFLALCNMAILYLNRSKENQELPV